MELDKEKFYHLFESIEDVRLKNCSIGNGGNICFLSERAFAYELYYQWNQHLCDSNLIINAEVTKKINDKYTEKAKKLFGKKTNRFIPDFVLHHSNESNDDTEQKIVCEVKINKELTSKSLIKDIKKLIAYTDKNKKAILYNPFEYGVFILLNGNFAKLERTLNIHDFQNEDISKIVCVTVNVLDGKVNVAPKYLANILKIENS